MRISGEEQIHTEMFDMRMSEHNGSKRMDDKRERERAESDFNVSSKLRPCNNQIKEDSKDQEPVPKNKELPRRKRDQERHPIISGELYRCLDERCTSLLEEER
jgi:hypothetical protein